MKKKELLDVGGEKPTEEKMYLEVMDEELFREENFLEGDEQEYTRS
jgi:hypothetical protein